MVSVELEGTANIAHESGMAETEAFYVSPLDEGNSVTCNDIVVGLEGHSSKAGVVCACACTRLGSEATWIGQYPPA